MRMRAIKALRTFLNFVVEIIGDNPVLALVSSSTILICGWTADRLGRQGLASDLILVWVGVGLLCVGCIVVQEFRSGTDRFAPQDVEQFVEPTVHLGLGIGCGSVYEEGERHPEEPKAPAKGSPSVSV